MMGAPSLSLGQAQQRGSEQVFRKALNLVPGHALGFLNSAVSREDLVLVFPRAWPRICNTLGTITMAQTGDRGF